MEKRIEATKYIKRDDILAYPLRRATCDKGKANTRFVDGVEAAMEYAVITQSIGRIARTFEGKAEPVVYDYVDEGIQYLVRSYKKRCATYRKCGCKFIE